MDDPNNEQPQDQQHPRASLRGKGRQILLGQDDGINEIASSPDTTGDSLADEQPGSINASALNLTPEEEAALLDFSADSLAYEAEFTFPAADETPAALPPIEDDLPPDEPAIPDDDLPDETLLDWMAAPPAEDESLFDAVPDEYLDDVPPDESPEIAVAEFPPDAFDYGMTEPDHEFVPAEEDSQPARIEGLPLDERTDETGELPYYEIPYQPHDTVDQLTPYKPEEWSRALTAEPDAENITPVFERLSAWRAATIHAAPEDHDGGLVVSEGDVVDEVKSEVIADPFRSVERRQPADTLFSPTSPPDKGLLETLVDDERLQRLWQQIEALHEELVRSVRGDRGATDVYQQELLQASGLLLESRANYDDARAIVYRIRADLKRQEKVEADIMRYRPLLLNYYVGWGIALVVLFLLKQLFAGVAEAVGVEVVSALYFPTLLGIAGALVSGYLTLDRHTTRLRDFDPLHITWYLFNPMLGGVMGLLMFILASIANEDLLQEAAGRGEVAIAYLLCVIAGMNQSNVLKRLNDLVDRFGGGNSENSES